MIIRNAADLPILGRAMGIDYGSKKTGIAVTDKGLIAAFPLLVLNISNTGMLLNKIKKLAAEYEAKLLVLGIPDEEYYDISKYLDFAGLLWETLSLPVYLQDESYTSKMAAEILLHSGLNKRKRAKIDDKIAAKLILDNFLEKLSKLK